MNTHEQRHRGKRSDDETLFRGGRLLQVQRAVHELCWLLDRNYARHSAIKLVGDHHQLNKRQRLAVSRAACSLACRDARAAKCLAVETIRDQPLIIDGFNLVITVETALAGGLLLRCRDGCIRDLASVHGTYKQVHETCRALTRIGLALEKLGCQSVRWLFDAPVSNSGRLAESLRNLAESRQWNWRVELSADPDQTILASPWVAVTSDSAILDRVNRWTNLGAYLLANYLPEAWVLDFSNDHNDHGNQRLEP
ncbi:MAG: DUF434 domain-containing protein [Gammaproteobacteria bacterium]